MDLPNALFLGVIEGVTEFLPISSTGHLILAARLVGLEHTDFVKTFEIAIQLGAILAVVALYWRTLFLNLEVLKRLLAAFLPTAVIGLIFYKLIKQYLLGNETVVLWSLAIGGFLLILFERGHREDEGALRELDTLPYPKAIAIGLFQSVAMIPGVSRAAATIIGGLALGLSRQAIVEFSFLLAVPTMLAATALDLFKNPPGNGEWDVLATGFVAAFIVAWASVKFLIRYIKTHNFTAFGWYRIAAAAVFWLFVIR